MIVSGWELHVYCEGKDCDRRAEMGGVDRIDAEREIRKLGWVFVGKHRQPGRRVYCVDCYREMKKAAKVNP